MKTLYLLFSHTLTAEQDIDAKQSLGISEIIKLPEELQQQWSNVPADAESIKKMLKPFKKWLKENVSTADYVLIQGDFGMTYSLVRFALKKGFTPIYATTERVSVEEQLPDGTVTLKKVFKHKRFRKYGA